ncbi:MAG: radical SAM family heme chaperone HemW [Saprospiraceae bacterium]|nr:radical SAM family heme chaperone HemW [Saprospiraceae bacterium]
MAGIYVHIPFCKQACHYCNFHFSTALASKDVLISAILREIFLRKSYLHNQSIGSIYFGGGTPSILDPKAIHSLIHTIKGHFDVDLDAEVTLEANPDDMEMAKLEKWAEAGVNRLSIGVQSFQEEDLRFMNRAHNAREARRAIEEAQTAGFYNLSVDLIYGAPTTSHLDWKRNLDTVSDLEVPHLSCYALTVEPKTVLDHRIKTEQIQPLDPDHAAEQFELLQRFAVEEGYVHYEISNLAKAGFEAIHNANYWSGAWYLGVGPSAHSFNGSSRSWNVAHNHQYVAALQEDHLPLDTEILSRSDGYNEYVMTHMRTAEGCDLAEVAKLGVRYVDYFMQSAEPYLKKGQIIKEGQQYCLSERARLLCDRISADLFYAEED